MLTFAHMTMLGVLIALAPRELYGHGADALADQQQGGAVMVLAGALAYPAAALWLSRSLLAPRAASGGANVSRARYVLLGAAGLLIAALVLGLGGVIPIQASSGHWRATAWVLDLIKRRSVHTYSRMIVPPRGRSTGVDRARRRDITRAGAASCHGVPGRATTAR